MRVGGPEILVPMLTSEEVFFSEIRLELHLIANNKTSAMNNRSKVWVKHMQKCGWHMLLLSYDGSKLS